MDYARCVKALERRFGGEWLILAKLHPNIAEKASQLDLDPRYIVNASGYPDIQELYLACDGLVTDYSSVMFDYLITGKPCFLYVNDLAAYKADRNFTFDIDKLPFPGRRTTASWRPSCWGTMPRSRPGAWRPLTGSSACGRQAPPPADGGLSGRAKKERMRNL